MSTVRIFRHYLDVRTVLLGLIQALALVGSVYAGVYLRFISSGDHLLNNLAYPLMPALVYAFTVVVCLNAMGLYQTRLRGGILQILLRIILSFCLAELLLAVIVYVFPSFYLGRGAHALSALIGFSTVSLTSILFFSLLDREGMKRRIVFYGAGSNAAGILSTLRRRSDQRLFNLVGCVGLPTEVHAVDPNRLIDLNSSLLTYATENRIEEIVVAVDDRRGNLPMNELLACRAAGIEISDLVSFYERHAGKIRCDLMQPSWFIFSAGFRKSSLHHASKRLLDVVGASFALILFSPVLLLSVFATLVESRFRKGAFYRQVRVGQHGREFVIWKLRSMRDDAEQSGKAEWATENDHRVTKVGRILRKYRFDELPQLINVLKGDMSLVGPRPERPEFVASLAEVLPHYELRHRVRPGITGWAQLCYPYGASQKDALEKLQFDLYYVKNGSLFLDMVVLMGTIEVILFQKGAR